jgi:hypothetical protein
MAVSAETMRRWLHDLGWVWKRATRVAKDDAPPRVARLAQIRCVFEQRRAGEAMLFADALEMARLPKVGAAWMPQGPQLAIMTPGTKATHDLAGARDLATGTLHHGLGARNTNALARDLLTVIEGRYPAERYTRLSVGLDHDKSHQAKAVAPWLAPHPRFTRLFVPTDCPRANPLERAFGDVHDVCTRHHKRTRVRDLVADVEAHVQVNGPWPYPLSQLYDEPAVTAAVESMAVEERSEAAA